MQGGPGAGSECPNGALCFCRVFIHSGAGSGTNLGHPPRDGALQLLAGHPSPDRQIDRQPIALPQDQRTQRSQLHRLRCKQVCECRLGLMHLGSDGAWKAEKGQPQLRRRAKAAAPLLWELLPSSGKARGPDAWSHCSAPRNFYRLAHPLLRNRNISSLIVTTGSPGPKQLGKEPRPNLRTGARQQLDGAVSRTCLERGCGARLPQPPCGARLLLGVQVLHILLDPLLLWVTTELLALLGGEAVGRMTGHP